jgi:hypothetical protein
MNEFFDRVIRAYQRANAHTTPVQRLITLLALIFAVYSLEQLADLWLQIVKTGGQ